MRLLAVLMFLTTTDYGMGGTLDLAIGVNCCSFENRGQLGGYLGKDFANHVILPLLTRVCDAILDERNMNYAQNVVLLILSIIVLGVLVFGGRWVYAKRHFLSKMNLLIAQQTNEVPQPPQRFANEV